MNRAAWLAALVVAVACSASLASRGVTYGLGPDEIRLSGTVVSVNAKDGSFVMKASECAVMSGESLHVEKISPPRRKLVYTTDRTYFCVAHSKLGGAVKATFTALKPKANVSIYGKNAGKGKPVTARHVTVRAYK